MEERKEQDARQRADASEREGECERAKMMEATQAHLIITPAHMSRRIHVCHMRRRIYVCHISRNCSCVLNIGNVLICEQINKKKKCVRSIFW